MEETTAIGSKQFIIVKLGKELYGIDIQYVLNIDRMTSITRVPKSPSYIKGVMNLRGDVIPVMSLRLKFNLNEDSYDNNTRIIIIKIEGHPIGIIVDAVREVIEISEDRIEVIDRDSTDDQHHYILGVARVESDLVSLLNLQGLIDSIR